MCPQRQIQNVELHFEACWTWGSNCNNGNFEDASVGFVLRVAFPESQVVDPLSSPWRDCSLQVFAFIAFRVKTDRHCSVTLESVPISEESDSQCLTVSCSCGEGCRIWQVFLPPDLGFLHAS